MLKERIMNLSPHESSILQKARRLDQLEKNFLKFTYETSTPNTPEDFKEFLLHAFKIAYEAFTLKNEIFKEVHDLPELKIHDNNVLKLLDRIRNGDLFYSISFYESQAQKINANANGETEEIPESIEDCFMLDFDSLFEDFHSWFYLIGYYCDKARIGPIISSSKVPDHILVYFNELKETYAFGQYRSSLAMCRSLLEMAIYNKLKTRGVFNKKNSKIAQIDIAKEDNLYKYINLAKQFGLITSANHEIAHKIRMAANFVLHPKDAENKLDSTGVLKTLLDTIKIIESLYR